MSNISLRRSASRTLAALTLLAGAATSATPSASADLGAFRPAAPDDTPGAAEMVDAAPADREDVVRAPDGLFYVRGLVNGSAVRFVLDTGASYAVLSERDAAAAGIEVQSAGGVPAIRTVGGTVAITWATLRHVRIAGRDLYNVRAAVTHGGGHVSLLGQNMLQRFESVTIRGDRASLR